jgi:hypothetical protein
LVVALADDLGISPKNRKSGNSVFTRVSATYPSLVVVKRGSPEIGLSDWMQNTIKKYQSQTEQAFGVFRFENGKLVTDSNGLFKTLCPVAGSCSC